MVLVIGCKSSGYFKDQELKGERLYDNLVISFPESYKGQGYFAGDDSKGFKKQKNDGKVDFRFETGSPVVRQPIQISSKEKTKVLPTGYEYKATTKNSDKVEGLVFVRSTNARLRDREAMFFLYNAEKKLYIETLKASYMSDLYEEVEAIFRTIRVSD